MASSGNTTSAIKLVDHTTTTATTTNNIETKNQQLQDEGEPTTTATGATPTPAAGVKRSPTETSLTNESLIPVLCGAAASKSPNKTRHTGADWPAGAPAGSKQRAALASGRFRLRRSLSLLITNSFNNKGAAGKGECGGICSDADDDDDTKSMGPSTSDSRSLLLGSQSRRWLSDRLPDMSRLSSTAERSGASTDLTSLSSRVGVKAPSEQANTSASLWKRRKGIGAAKTVRDTHQQASAPVAERATDSIQKQKQTQKQQARRQKQNTKTTNEPATSKVRLRGARARASAEQSAANPTNKTSGGRQGVTTAAAATQVSRAAQVSCRQVQSAGSCSLSIANQSRDKEQQRESDTKKPPPATDNSGAARGSKGFWHIR